MILLSIYMYIRGYLLNSRFRFEVLEISWNELLNKLQKARDMNELIQAQRLFISRILEKLMLKEKFRSQYQRIRQLLDLTVRYHSFMRTWAMFKSTKHFDFSTQMEKVCNFIEFMNFVFKYFLWVAR
jgi:hypothetical protein